MTEADVKLLINEISKDSYIMKDYLQLGIDKGLISFNEDKCFVMNLLKSR